MKLSMGELLRGIEMGSSWRGLSAGGKKPAPLVSASARAAQWLLGILVAVLLVGCSGYSRTASVPRVDGIAGSGRLVTQQFALSGFTGIEARSAFKVDVFQSDSYQVSVTADDNVMGSVEVGVAEGKLTLSMRPGSYVRTTYRASVGMPSLRSLELSEATTATISEFKSADSLKIQLQGASKLTGRVEARQVSLVPREASVVTLGGTAESLNVESSGASEANLGDLAVGSASVSLREASRATVNVVGGLDADLRAASTLYYVGNPSLGSVTSLEASSLRRR
jgi:hypothetical protein